MSQKTLFENDGDWTTCPRCGETHLLSGHHPFTQADIRQGILCRRGASCRIRKYDERVQAGLLEDYDEKCMREARLDLAHLSPDERWEVIYAELERLQARAMEVIDCA